MKALGPHWQQLVAMLARQDINLVFDVGANIGQYAGALRASGWGGRIVSFEPQAADHATLSAEAAGDADWIVPPAMALGAEPDKISLHVSNETDMSSFRPMRADYLDVSPTSAETGQESVPVATLDTLFDDFAGPDDKTFFKIDTQGWEAEVLDGAVASLPRIAGIQIELSLVPIYEGEPGYREMLDRLHGLGFATWLIIPGYFDRHLGRMLQFDAVMFRDPKETQ